MRESIKLGPFQWSTKGVQITCIVSATPIPPAKLSPEMEAALGAEIQQEPMSISMCQERLQEKLNLDGLSNWSPRNAATMRELVLAHHDIFALDNNELGCTSAIEHKIRINDSEPFKEWFRPIPPLLLEEVCASLWNMLDAGAICPSQSPWCNMVVLIHKKYRTLCFCIDFCCLKARTKKNSYPLPWIQEALESLVGAVHFSTMDFKSSFWQVKMAPDSQQYTTFTVGNRGSTSLPTCLLASAMLQQLYSPLCRTHWES